MTRNETLHANDKEGSGVLEYGSIGQGLELGGKTRTEWARMEHGQKQQERKATRRKKEPLVNSWAALLRWPLRAEGVGGERSFSIWVACRPGDRVVLFVYIAPAAFGWTFVLAYSTSQGALATAH